MKDNVAQKPELDGNTHTHKPTRAHMHTPPGHIPASTLELSTLFHLCSFLRSSLLPKSPSPPISVSVFVSVNLCLFPFASVTGCVSASLSATFYVSSLPLSVHVCFSTSWALSESLCLPALLSPPGPLGLTSLSLQLRGSLSLCVPLAHS